jgi:hypothetical protein
MRSSLSTHGIVALSVISSIFLGWSHPNDVPRMKCRGGYSAEQLERYLPSARVTLWLPGTRAVGLDSERRCLMVTVDGAGSMRLAELVLRAVSVPRRAVQVRVTPSSM